MLTLSLLSKEAKNKNFPTMFFLPHDRATFLLNFSQKGLKLAVNELETCARSVEILVLKNKAKCTLGRFFRCRAIRSQNVWKVIAYWLMKWGLLLFRQQSSHLQIVPQRGFKYARFLAGNTNKALCFAATLVVLDALDAMTCAMEEATGYILWKLRASKANCA